MFASKPRGSRRAVVIAVAVVALVVGLWFGGHPSWLPKPLRSAFVDSNSQDRIVDDVLGLLQRDYYRPIARSDLVNKGLAAAVASLHDPYSHYFDPADYHSFQNESNQHLSGIGIYISNGPQGLRVLEEIGRASCRERVCLAV